MLRLARRLLTIFLISARADRANARGVQPGYYNAHQYAFGCHESYMRDCPEYQYNACGDDNQYTCRSCGTGMFVPFDVHYPVSEDCRRCPSWTRNVINSAVWLEVFVKCTAFCEKQSSNALEDIYADYSRSDACHRLVGDNRQCTVCPSGKYRIQTPPPVTTWNAPERSHYSVYHDCAFCPGNTFFRSIVTGGRRPLDFAGDIGFESGLAGATEPCGDARCTECPINCASEKWLGAGSCEATTTDTGHDYGIASPDRTRCNPCRVHYGDAPFFQWVPPSGTPECLMCAAGTELAVQQDFASYHQWYAYKECRVTTSAAELRWVAGVGYDADECCHMCKTNKYRPYNHLGLCEYCPGDETTRGVDNTQVARGGVSCAPCSRGFKLMHCTMLSADEGGPGDCFESSFGDPARYWRVCVPCDENEYFLTDGKCARCDPYATVGNPARGDRRSADDTLCEFCPACETNTVDPFTQSLVTWPPDTQELSATRTHQTQTCQPLARRELKADDGLVFVAEGTDMHKPTPSSAPTPVPPFHTLTDAGQSVCTLRHCAEACTDFFMYARGCGPQESDPFVRNATSYLRLSQLNEVVTLHGATTGWSLAPEGFCTLCTACSDGQYNSACATVNSFALNLAAGVCTPCDVACPDAGYWKDHERGSLGCSWPADFETTAFSGHGLPQAPYTCRQCPRWIQRPVIGRDYYEMYAPEACGNTLRYHTWGFAAPCDNCDCELENTENALAGPLRIVTRCVRSLAEHQADPTTDAVVVDSFRRHLSPLRPYCPPHYYFDTNICGQFIAQSELCALNSADTCGFDVYNHECCTRCAVCDVAEGRRNGPDYRDCSGATSEDTQAGDDFRNCVTGDACPTNYFRSTDSSGAASCEACSSCSAGEL